MSTDSTQALGTTSEVLPATVRQRYQDGYALHKDLLASVPDSDLTPINLDVMNLVTTVTGACHNILALREQLAQLPGFDVAKLDRLPTLAYALGFTHTRYFGALTPVGPVSALAATVARYRDLFVHGIVGLQQRELIPADAMRDFVGGKAFKVAAFETVAAANMLREQPPEVFALAGVTAEELTLGCGFAGELTEQLGVREQVPAGVSSVARERQQAYTLVLRDYDQARRAVTYLRWSQGDADAIAPSLYAGRSRRSEQPEPQPSPQPAPNAPMTPSLGDEPTQPAMPALDPRSPGMNPFTS